MSISDLELVELKSRTANAIRTNSSLANVEGHIGTLKAVLGESRTSRVKVQGNPTAYLYQLILQVESMGTEPEPEPAPIQIKQSEPVQVKQPEPAPSTEVVETSVLDEVVEKSPTSEEPGVNTSEKHSKSKREKREKKL